VLVPLSWLRDFADFPDDVGLLRATLDDLGLVVEAIETMGEGLGDVIVARIDAVDPIEGADRIRLVTIEAGAGALEVVCGATNFSVGDLVPFAPVGAVLPGEFKISKRTMKGVVSYGMLCSGKELGLGDDHSGLMLLTELDGAVPGVQLTELLGLEPDVVFDVTVEGNRPDAHSIAGLARDLAARLGLEFRPVTPKPPAASGPPAGELATGEVLDLALCPRLALGVATGVTVGDSPSWIRQRLAKAGMRPINNVVDASNYVMIEMGQPSHPYDLDRVGGQGLRVRRAKPGETIVTLDGVERSLGVGGKSLGDTGEDCVICDANDEIIGIAGIMGGQSSEISDTTSAVLLEAASFDAIALTRTSRRLAHRTDAAARFQKGSDPAILETALDRFFELLALSSPGLAVAPLPILIPEAAPEPFELQVPLDRVETLLGVTQTSQEVAGLLQPLGFVVTERSPGELEVLVPTNRPDVRHSSHGVADVIEEIARTYGYSRLPRRASAWPQPGRHNERQRPRSIVRQVFVGFGASEAWTSSLVAPGEAALVGIVEPELVVANPLTAEESRLRRSLLPGLLRALGYNADRRQAELALFELGAIFIHPEVPRAGRSARAGAAGGQLVSLPSERELAVALLARPSDDARTAVAVARALGDALGMANLRMRAPQGETVLAGFHPTRSALMVDGRSGATLGAVGEVDPRLVQQLAPGLGGQRVAIVMVDLDQVDDPEKCTRRSPVATVVSRFPSADLDLAFVAADTMAVDALSDVLSEAGGSLLESLRLFDVYRGSGVDEGSRSLAFSVRLCAEDHTLSDEEISEVRSSMIEAAASLGALLR
jgi:phenylalanyl-tRNA synthetase beta chain